MRKFFSMNGMMVLGQGLVGKIGNLFGKGAKQASENLNKREASIFGDLVEQQAKRSGKTIDVVKKEMGDELAEQARSMQAKLGTPISAKLAQYGAAAVAVPTAVAGAVGVAGSLNMGFSGKDSITSKAIENWMEGGKVADSLSDMKGLFSRIAEFFKLVVNGIQNFDKILKGDLSWMDNPEKSGNPGGPTATGENGTSPATQKNMDAGLTTKIANTVEAVVPNALDQGNSTLAVAEAGLATVVAGYGAKKVYDGISSKVTSAPLKETGNVAIEAADDVAKKGGLSKFFRSASSFKGNAVINGVLAAGAGTYALLSGASKAEAAETAADTLGYGETVKNIDKGDYDAAIHSGTVATGALATSFAGAAAGAAIGTAVIPVPVLGTIVGGVAGAVAASTVGTYIGEAAYSAGSYVAGGISSLFNSKADPSIATPEVAAVLQPSFLKNEPTPAMF